MKKIIFLTICSLFLFGCQGGQEKSVNKSAETNTAVNSANTTVADTGTSVKQEEIPSEPGTKESVISATKKLQEVKFWTANIDSKDVPQIKSEMQYFAPDRYYIKQTNNELIIIGKDGYIKGENGKWEKSEEDYSSMINVGSKQLAESLMNNLQGVKVVGEEKLKGKDVNIYSYQVPTPTKDIAIIKVWITKGDNLLLQTEVETKLPTTSQKIITTYDYEKPVKIEVPQIK